MKTAKRLLSVALALLLGLALSVPAFAADPVLGGHSAPVIANPRPPYRLGLDVSPRPIGLPGYVT
ncbi:MAG: hypothetical protein LBB75_00780 [Oscillospiraceae bacterium]|jgi:hypothetical protein|nr:hypothetical protein [Oscillospiraceae bacterium]